MLASRRNLHRDLTLEGGHEDLPTDHGRHHRHFRTADQFCALTGEPVVGLDPHLDVEVSLAPAARPRVSRSGDPDSLSVLDPGGDIHLPGAHLLGPPGAPAAIARSLGHSPLAPAAIAWHRPNDLAEDA